MYEVFRALSMVKLARNDFPRNKRKNLLRLFSEERKRRLRHAEITYPLSVRSKGGISLKHSNEYLGSYEVDEINRKCVFV